MTTSIGIRIFMECGLFINCLGRGSYCFCTISYSQKTKNVFGLIFRALERQFLSFCVPQKLELNACPTRCVMSEIYDGCWKELSFSENKIRISLFFTNTKTTKFIIFPFDFPHHHHHKMEGSQNVISERGLLHHPQMSVIGMPGIKGVGHLQ